jgi:uncharacterized protein with von Willebrand factor type A (vWA) domain
MTDKTGQVSGAALAANLTLFGRLLRRAGLTVDAEQTRLLARVLTLISVGRRADVKASARTVFVRRAEDRGLFDAAFDLFWRRSTVEGRPSPALPRVRQARHSEPLRDPGAEPAGEESVADAVDLAGRQAPSSREVLRTMDFAELSAGERRDAEAMLDSLRMVLPLRPSRRQMAGRRGRRLATRAMLRRSLGSGGEAVDWRWLERRTRPRPLVLVCDISGSMAGYTRLLLRFAHALGRGGAPLEVFVFGTRLTRLTRELRGRDADAALRRATHKVADWSGGTRIGASLRELNLRWVRRTVRSGAVVLIASDGWERGDPELLARQMATLRRSCHRIVWLDPLASRPGFVPATLGLRAALPHVDEFVPCASVASLQALAAKLTRLPEKSGLRSPRG